MHEIKNSASSDTLIGYNESVNTAEKRSPPKLTGVEILNRSIDYIRSHPQQNETAYSHLSAVQKKNLFDIHASINSPTRDEYVTKDGKVRLLFVTQDGHTICAEIKEKEALNDLDWSAWANYTTGCIK